MSNAQITDLYEVSMAHSYLREHMTSAATFSLAVRHLPPGRGFLVAAGLESAVEMLSDLRIDEEDVEAYASALGRPAGDLRPLSGLRFTGDVRAVPEGTVVLADEPLLEVSAPLPEAQLVETMLLNQVCYQTTLASKAVRCVVAASGRPVVDFSLRRTHGVEAGMQAARLGAMGGFAGTSNVAAARAFGLPAVGTMAHSYIEAFDDEETAFRAFVAAHPGPVTLLVDTYDTAAGALTAARVLRDEQLADGCAVRLDSGDLGVLSAVVRRILDAYGLSAVRITASGGLDEYEIDRLVRLGAPIDVFAVGTHFGVSADAPSLDAAYKLVVYDGRPTMKLSQGKVTAPGAKQVFRGPGVHDVVGLRDEPAPPGTRPLLRTVMVQGRRLGTRPPLSRVRAELQAGLGELPQEARRTTDPRPPEATESALLRKLTDVTRGRAESFVATKPSGTGVHMDVGAGADRDNWQGRCPGRGTVPAGAHGSTGARALGACTAREASAMTGGLHIVRDVMTREVVTVGRDTPFREIVRIQQRSRVSAVPVVGGDGRVVGVVSEADLLPKEEFRDAVPSHLADTRRLDDMLKAGSVLASDLMTAPAVTVEEGDTLSAAARIMAAEKVKRLPVTDTEGKLCGIVSRSDLLKVFLRQDEEIAEEVRREIVAYLFPGEPPTVRVDVSEGTVTLSGRVRNTARLPVAARLARSVEGVVDVRLDIDQPAPQ